MNTREMTIVGLVLLALVVGVGTIHARSLDKPSVHGTYVHGQSRPLREEYLRIDAESITKFVICRDGDQMETLEVTAPARVTDRTLEILAPALDVRRVGEVDCVARLDRGKIDYHVDRYNSLTLHPHFGGWRRHYVMVGAERPGLWQELRHDVAAIKSHLKRFGQRAQKAVRAGADAWVDREVREAEMKADMIDRAYDGASRLSRRMKPAPRGKND